MRLYIVRHAIADPHGTPNVKDDDRSLTAEGVRKMQDAAEGLRRLGYIPDLIYTSPLVRAARTAEILREVFGRGLEAKNLPALAPSGARDEVYRAIASSWKTYNSLMIVGHQPSLGEIAREILGGSQEDFIEFKKGGACAIDLVAGGRPPKGIMISLLTPAILRRIAE